MRPTPFPFLDQLLADPARVVADLPPEAVTPLLADMRRAVTYLETRQQSISSGDVAAQARGNGQNEAPAEDKPLTVKEAAAKVGMSVDYMYRNAKSFPFTVRHGRSLRFSSKGIEQYIRQQQNSS